MITRRQALAGAATLLAFSATRAKAAQVHRFEMVRMRFGAAPAGIKAGDIILWVNRDVVPHTATARDGSFDVTLAAGASGRSVVARIGRIEVYCRYHPAMRTSLAVGR